MYKVGITGGIGSGKSSVCKMLAVRGVPIYDSDSRAKQLMVTDAELVRLVSQRFGADVYVDGMLNRQVLAARVFTDKVALAELNSMVHPAVMRDFERWAAEQQTAYVVMESAIIFEAGLDDKLDAVVAVMAPCSLRLERAMQRDGATREQIEERMRAQLSDDELARRAKYAILNISLDELDEEVEQLHRRLSYDARAK
ncbi:MAG: dephospho-CoA kinase [Alistipes sp.]|nr:dephospho-CoA kinase [Alistipes sp.]